MCQEIKANAKGRVQLGNDSDDARKAASQEKKSSSAGAAAASGGNSKGSDALEGMHDSTSVYMLMYRKESSVQELEALDTACNVSDVLRADVAAENTVFSSEIEQATVSQGVKAEELRQKCAAVVQLWSTLTLAPEGAESLQYEFVPTPW